MQDSTRLESSRRNGISHDMDLERICRSHISHRKRLITVNPFTSFRAGVNTKKRKNIFIHLCLGLFYIAWPTLCQRCLLTISHCELPSCLCGPSDLPSPSICKDEGLIKTIFPINIPGPRSPSSRAGRPPGLLQCCSGPDPSSAIQRQRRCVWLGQNLLIWRDLRKRMWGELCPPRTPPPSPQESKLARLVFKRVAFCVHLYTVCVCVFKRERKWNWRKRRKAIRKCKNELGFFFF